MLSDLWESSVEVLVLREYRMLSRPLTPMVLYPSNLTSKVHAGPSGSLGTGVLSIGSMNSASLVGRDVVFAFTLVEYVRHAT
jgi:hypothetical protein